MSIYHLRAVIGWLALAGMCLPTTGWTAYTTALPAPQIADVALRDGGVLVGQIVNGQNAPQNGVRVSLQDVQNREVAAAVTDRQGAFAISGVRSGVYQVVMPQGRQIYRLWSQGIAPPSAQQGVLLVTPGETVRGELGDGSMGNFISNPLVIGAAIATAIAVPVVVIATNRSPSSP